MIGLEQSNPPLGKRVQHPWEQGCTEEGTHEQATRKGGTKWLLDSNQQYLSKSDRAENIQYMSH